WRKDRCVISGEWTCLRLYRLGNADLFLSKLMRDDPIDQAAAAFIVNRAGWNAEEIAQIVQSARVPQAEEIQEQFVKCASRFLLDGSVRGSRVELNSEAIKAVTYDENYRLFKVEFKDRTYCYFDVPKEIYDALINAESAGI